MAIKQVEKLEVEDEFNVTRKVSALGFTKLELSTKQRLHGKNAVEYEQTYAWEGNKSKNYPVKVRRI